jgi:hypothetical protein
MGTRSRIGVMHGDVCKSVYCHWDGYLEHNGVILQEHYDSAKANHLVALGDISSLKRNVDFPDGEFHTFDSPMENVTVFYGRDRDEDGTDFATDHTFEAFFERAKNCGAEWYYIMKDGVWYVGNTHENDARYYQKLVLLLKALVDEMEVSKTWDTVDL